MVDKLSFMYDCGSYIKVSIDSLSFLQLQNERLTKIENAASDNNAMVEDLKFKERV